MSYITTAQSDTALARPEWVALSLNDKTLYLEQASARIEMIPFHNDDKTLKDGGYDSFPRYVAGKKTNADGSASDIQIENALAGSVANLAYWYYRNPNAGHNTIDYGTGASSIVVAAADLPLDVQSGLWQFMAVPFRTGEDTSPAPAATGEQRRVAKPLTYGTTIPATEITPDDADGDGDG